MHVLVYYFMKDPLIKLCDQPILVRGTITIFLILIIPIYQLFTIDKRRVNLKVQYSMVRKLNAKLTIKTLEACRTDSDFDIV